MAGRARLDAVHGRRPAVDPARTAQGDRGPARLPGRARCTPTSTSPPGSGWRTTGRCAEHRGPRSATGCSPSRPSATRRPTRTAPARRVRRRPAVPRRRRRTTAREPLLRIRRAGRPGLPRRPGRRALPWDEVRVVGFSCTFQQNTASFALARRLKERHPGLVTVFGGANFDGEMGLELVRCIDCIDLAVIGEGDARLSRAARARSPRGADARAVPGVVRRKPAATSLQPGPAARVEPGRARRCRTTTSTSQRAEELGLLPRGGRRNVWLPFEIGPRVLVGRQAPLHVLRAQRRRPCGSAPSRRERVLDELASRPAGTAASASRPSTTSSTRPT